jgi:hypothetical protein
VISLPGLERPVSATPSELLAHTACTPSSPPPATSPHATAPSASNSGGSSGGTHRTPRIPRPHPHRSPTAPHPSKNRVVKIPDPFRPLSIHTFPAVPGAKFKFVDRTVETDKRGVATFTLTVAERNALGANRSAVLTILTPTVQIDPSHRAAFAGWIGKGTYKWHKDNDPGAIEVASFDTSHLIDFQFTSLAGGSVDPSTLLGFKVQSDSGEDVTLDPTKPNWLLANEVLTGSEGPVLRNVNYVVEAAEVRGADVVHSGQQNFIPAVDPHVTVELLFYRVTFHASDTLYGGSVGSSLLLRYPDKSTAVLPVRDGSATAPNLPRGGYELTVQGAGPRIVRPVSVSRSQVMRLDVVTWVDVATALAAGLVVALMVLGAAVLSRRRHRRRAGSPAPAPPSPAPVPPSSLGVEGAG